MANAVSIDLKNFKSFDKFLDRFPPAVRTDKVAITAMKKAQKPLVKAMRAGVPIGRQRGFSRLRFKGGKVVKPKTQFAPGALKKSIGTTVAKRKQGPLGRNVVATGPRRSKKLRGFTGTFIESGTAERVQKTTGRKTGRIQPRPFAAPAFNATVGTVQKNLKRELAIAVTKEAKKQAAKAGSTR